MFCLYSVSYHILILIDSNRESECTDSQFNIRQIKTENSRKTCSDISVTVTKLKYHCKPSSSFCIVCRKHVRRKAHLTKWNWEWQLIVQGYAAWPTPTPCDWFLGGTPIRQSLLSSPFSFSFCPSLVWSPSPPLAD